MVNMIYMIDSEGDDFCGDKITFITDGALYWIENPDDALLDKKQMKVFLKKCLDFLEAEE